MYYCRRRSHGTELILWSHTSFVSTTTAAQVFSSRTVVVIISGPRVLGCPCFSLLTAPTVAGIAALSQEVWWTVRAACSGVEEATTLPDFWVSGWLLIQLLSFPTPNHVTRIAVFQQVLLEWRARSLASAIATNRGCALLQHMEPVQGPIGHCMQHMKGVILDQVR